MRPATNPVQNVTIPANGHTADDCLDFLCARVR